MCYNRKKGVEENDKIYSQSYACKKRNDAKELAEKTGIRPPTISAICTGSVKHLPVDALDKICAVLDCQPADIMEYIKSDVQ